MGTPARGHRCSHRIVAREAWTPPCAPGKVSGNAGKRTGHLTMALNCKNTNILKIVRHASGSRCATRIVEKSPIDVRADPCIGLCGTATQHRNLGEPRPLETETASGHPARQEQHRTQPARSNIWVPTSLGGQARSRARPAPPITGNPTAAGRTRARPDHPRARPLQVELHVL